jgi:hypothetical protein
VVLTVLLVREPSSNVPVEVDELEDAVEEPSSVLLDADVETTTLDPGVSGVVKVVELGRVDDTVLTVGNGVESSKEVDSVESVEFHGLVDNTTVGPKLELLEEVMLGNGGTRVGPMWKVDDGTCVPVPQTVLVAWMVLTGAVVLVKGTHDVGSDTMPEVLTDAVELRDVGTVGLGFPEVKVVFGKWGHAVGGTTGGAFSEVAELGADVSESEGLTTIVVVNVVRMGGAFGELMTRVVVKVE